MNSNCWTALGSLVVLTLACSETAEPPGGNNGGSGAATAGSGNPSGGASGAVGGSTGAVSGSTATGGAATGGTATGGTATGGAATGGTATGGTATGGMAGDGVSGTAGSGMSGGAGAAPTGGSGGSGPQVTCTITPTSSISARIATVGIVTFTTDLAGMTEAHIDFGRDTNYGMTAPVDIALADKRTLLLGMKPATQYHYRVVATGPSGTCTGTDKTLMTGARASGLPTLDVMTTNAAALSGGFLVTGQYQGSAGGSGAPAYILDADGTIVWWFMTGQNNVTGARMSADGKYMWINSANVPASQGAIVHRVSMDGMSDENLSSQFTGLNHQLAVLPDETIIFYAYSSGECDDIKERSPSGMVKTLINAQTAHGASGACHVNHIEYSREDDTIIFSDLDHNNYTKIRRNGEVVWVLGGPTNDFTGSATMWTRQHGLHALGANHFVFFNNGSMGGGGSSVAIELLLDVQAKTATRPWTYNAMPTIANQVMGDVQRMENGNTVVAYSTQGVLHEVNATGQLLQEINWPLGGAFGYIVKRKTLYGPSPR